VAQKIRIDPLLEGSPAHQHRNQIFDKVSSWAGTTVILNGHLIMYFNTRYISI